MPLTEEERKQRKRERDRKYREKNRELRKQNCREYYQKNKEKIKEYREKNKEYKKKYDNKGNWKRLGVIWKDQKEFESIWKEYTTQTHCEFCYTEFKPSGMDRKCLDHDHTNGEFRFILCNRCNIWRISD